jgi:hypothetical protein
VLTVLLAATALCLLRGAGKEGGCGQGLDNRAGEPGVDVGGKDGARWNVDYSDTIQVKITGAGGAVVTHDFTVAGGGLFDVEGTQIDLGKLCEREDVACPHEVFPSEVKMTQPGDQLHLLYVNFNAEGPLGELKDTTLLGNVDSDHDFSIALGIGAAAAPGLPCALLGVSYATGHIDNDGGDPPVGTSLSGDIVTGYAGGCVLIGSSGTASAGVSVELRVPFTATRIQ